MHQQLIGIIGTLHTWARLSVLLFISSIVSLSVAHGAGLTLEQQQYLDARQALKKNKIEKYKELRQQLDHYPLTVYLDFHHRINDIIKLDGDAALAEIEQFTDTPLFNTARYRYLMRVGSRKQWKNFLTVSPTRPNNTVLQCYYFRAQLANGDKESAFKGAVSLWLYGKSRPEECDPLFNAWQKAEQRTQELIWSRMLLSFNANQYGLLTYLSRKVTTHRDEAKLLLSVYKDPQSLRQTKRFAGSGYIHGDIVAAGLRKLARKDLNKAVKLYIRYQKNDRFTDYQGRKLSRYFVKRAIIKQEEGLKSFVDTMLPMLDSDDLIELRLRWAIRQSDTKSINTFLALLSEKKKSNPRWQYWQSRTNSLAPSEDEVLAKLSQRRNFYGFAAANELQREYHLEHTDTISDKSFREQLYQDKGLARVIELLAIDKVIDARSEWVLMLNRHNKDMQKEYATFALENGWDALGVQASIQAKLWNDMTLRFPYASNEAFLKSSDKLNVNIDEIRAIARRESAFYPYATSGVGARGLMQLMPATAKETAKKSGVKYRGHKSLYQSDLNIRLGTAYYASLLKQFDDNRILATAAYNAGPHRVKQWLKKTKGELDAISFIEAIPYSETREYVQAVLSYRVIYQIKQGKPVELFSTKELNYNY